MFSNFEKGHSFPFAESAVVTVQAGHMDEKCLNVPNVVSRHSMPSIHKEFIK